MHGMVYLQRVVLALLIAPLMALCGQAALAADARPGLKPCRLPGVEHEALCGSVKRPLDPAQPTATPIDVHYAVLPALARNRKPDPVFFFAGGPGQSAMELAGSVSRLLQRLSNRRDLVLIDQRGTGQSAPLRCPEQAATLPLAEIADPTRQLARLQACRELLQKLPHGDLRHYTTWVAMQDADAVRQALGVVRINLVGGSYGTRAVLDYQRQFPQAVRRAVIDGVAPPDMVLPAAFSTDNQAALDAVFSSCESQPSCSKSHPTLRGDWQALLKSLPRDFNVAHPATGRSERLSLTREVLLTLLRSPLYVPSLAAGLPFAIHEASQGRLEALLGLSTALGGAQGARRTGQLFEGMHFAVVCNEDLPRLSQATDSPGADFANLQSKQYQQLCEGWPRAEVPAAFYQLPKATGATLVLSGGADPATPSRHGARTAQALGPLAKHVVVAQAGHGVMGLGCMRDVLFKFFDADSDSLALAVDADCARALPRPPAYTPISAGTP
jgi:pimeloyl-ACP methyl ester carboxylesterase